MYHLLYKKFNNKEKEKVMTIHRIVHEAYAIAKDASIDSIDVTIDTSKWSTRKKNIIVRAIDSGVATCGWDTANFVKALTKTYGIGVLNATKWYRTIDVELINPDKLEEVTSYVSAMIKLRGHNSSYREDMFMRDLDEDRDISSVPIPSDFSTADQTKFVTDYLKPQDEADRIKRANLINNIRSGHKLTISFTI